MQMKIASVESKTQNKTKTVEYIFSSTNRFQEDAAVVLSENLLGNKISHFLNNLCPSVNIMDKLFIDNIGIGS